MKHLFILNPIAGGKKQRSADTQRHIEEFARTLGAPYEIYITKGPMDAWNKVAFEADANEKMYVYACGGDGTLNECVNGAAGRDGVAITIYPCGTGNDFVKTFGIDNMHRFRDFNALAAGTVRPLDLIDCNGRYGINICSVGIDARIGVDVHKYSKIPVIGGASGYIISLVINVIKGINQRLRITTDEMTLDKSVSLVCACNGRFYGGGFNPVPDAIPDDGLLEYLVVSELSRFKVAQVVGKYAKGRYRELGDIITHIRGTRMEIEADRDFVASIDGELFTTKKISFHLVPKGINFIFPVGVDSY